MKSERALLLFKLAIIVCYLLVATALFVSCVSADGADAGKSYKSGDVSANSAITTSYDLDYDQDATKPIAWKMYYNCDNVKNYKWFSTSRCRFSYQSGKNWDNTPRGVGDPFTIRDIDHDSGIWIGSGTVYVYAQQDMSSQAYVKLLFTFEAWNYSYLNDASGKDVMYIRPTGGSYANIAEFYTNQLDSSQSASTSPQYTTHGILPYISLSSNVQGTDAAGLSRCLRVISFYNEYDVTVQQYERVVNITREGLSSGTAFSSSLRMYNSAGEMTGNWSQSTSDETFYVVNEPMILKLYPEGFPVEYTFWDDTTIVDNPTLDGYVFDAKDKFLLTDALIDIDELGYDIYSDEDGYYSALLPCGGFYHLNSSLSGYQPLNNGSGIVLNITQDTRYNVPLIKNETVHSGTCTVAGVVLDSTTKNAVGSALVKIENASYDSYMYTNEMGYFVFYSLTNSSYTLTGSHEGYYDRQLDLSLGDIDTAYYYQLELVSMAVAPAPTPIPTPGDGGDPTVEGWNTIFEMMGLGDHVGYIMAFLCMLVGAGAMGYITRGSVMGVLIGGFFGYVIDVAIGWLPIWTVAVVICVTIFAIVKGVGR